MEVHMTCFHVRFGIAIGVSVFALACGGAVTPTAPSPSVSRLLGAQSIASNGSIHALSTTHGEQLTAVTGAGYGVVNVTPTTAVDGSFSAQINVNVHDAPPDTTFYVQRAPEIGRANSADGICQRAAGLPPWGAPAPNFVTFPLPGAGPLVTLHTSDGGSGAIHIDFAAPTIADGTSFDVMFRLVDSLTSPTNELRTGCFTVTAR
jgi:hypothetical protein